MTDSPSTPSPLVVVTGANGLVGFRVCAMLVAAGATVRAVVRRTGTAPRLSGLEEAVGDFGDPMFARSVVRGATAVVTTVHPMGSDEADQRRVAVLGTAVLARAARDAGVPRLVHISTSSVYERSPQTGDVDESSPLVGDDASDYAVTKRDTDAALAGIDGITTVLLRPPAILGSGPSSTWNTLRPVAIRDREDARSAVPDQTFAWVALDDLCALAAALATGRIAAADDPAVGPLDGACTPVNVSGGDHATMRDYFEVVCAAVGVEPVWTDAPAWRGRYVADRARAWGWRPTISLSQALTELAEGLRS